MNIGASEAKIAIKVLELAIKQGWLECFPKKTHDSYFGVYGNGENQFSAVFNRADP